MSELTRRIIFAVIAAPLAVGIIYVGGAVLATTVSILAAIAAWELCRIARAGGTEPLDVVAIVLAAAIPLAVHGVRLQLLRPDWTHAAILLLAVLAAVIFVRGPGRQPLRAAAVTLFVAAYVGMFGYVYALRYDDYVVDARGGTAMVMLPLLVTWASDIGAYAVGRMVGKHKLIPAVSPGKTVEGALGGLLLSVVIAVLYANYALRPLAQLALAPVAAIVVGAVLSAVAQIGDLAESLLKREAGVKDSSTLLPGHGGVLDRFDSVLFVLPCAVLLLHAFVVPAPV